MAKKQLFECTNCGSTYPKWSGRCDSCGEWNTIEEKQIVESIKNNLVRNRIEVTTADKISKTSNMRVESGFQEFDRVLGESANGKGFVVGSVVLITGAPGIGKSSLLIDVCSKVSSEFENIYYVSGEESVEQVGMRAQRIIDESKSLSRINLIHSNDVDSILDQLKNDKADFVIIDSIQTIQSQDNSGFAGGIAQVRACTNKLVSFAKSHNVTVMLVGHINKEGNIAGPKVLEHLVDTVITIEGEEDSDLRVVKSIKNRFGATNEVGILKMDNEGLVDVVDPSAFFLSNKPASGVCKSILIEGNRALVLEVQALVSRTIFAYPKRVAEGISISRLQIISAIMQKYLKINLTDNDIYINVSGGMKLVDRGLDLAVALSIYSAFKDIKVKTDLVSFGEVSLTGQIKNVSRTNMRVKESRRLGYKNIVSSESISSIKDISKYIR